ncbi:hypothetical protein [Ectothiorhodospira shaposhnikovii]|uniref:hypothetical protein n=1 Tax=Ectothiorhodospira shaposhnikovii TaxID=1054 RepID=UPI001EE84C5E|nr:hypothetical protein [Ectothiorhodospira shaposhnikovii]
MVDILILKYLSGLFKALIINELKNWCLFCLFQAEKSSDVGDINENAKIGMYCRRHDWAAGDGDERCCFGGAGC